MSKTLCRPVAALAAAIFLAMGAAHGAETTPKFLGANSCASSSCHGGGGEKQNQFLVWSLKDFHSQRPVATLTTARSKQIADALEIKDPTMDVRCTSCHAPLNSIPENLRGESFKVSEGVSCESCHGPAENWIRSHTRHDFSHADRIASGMRDLQNLYVRANACVACHQNVDADILKAGHPELIFELDGQSVAEPKHWSAEKNGNGAQAWLVGQLVALREMNYQLPQQVFRRDLAENQILRWEALGWLVRLAPPFDDAGLDPMPASTNLVDSQKYYNRHYDRVAQTIAAIQWTPDLTKKCLKNITEDALNSFRADVEASIAARRAERLVLALDRLVAALPELKTNGPVQASLNQLFKLTQSIPDFDPKEFSGALEKFSMALPK